MSSRALIVLIALLAMFVLGWLVSKAPSSRRQLPAAPALTINKQPVDVTTHAFDPAVPPREMPPLGPNETAECDSNFLSSASVRGEIQKIDATHATLAVTHVHVMLQLRVNIWLPNEAPQNLIDHEEGHRQIAEFIYQTADKLAERIAASYLGRRVEIAGADLDAESARTLHQLATEITDEYGKQLNPSPPQLLYDSLTDHAKNGVVASAAVDHVLKNAPIESTASPTAP